MSSQFVSSTNRSVESGTTSTAVTFLAPSSSSCNDAWIVASAAGGSQHDVLRVWLEDALGSRVSGTAELFGTTPSRVRLLNVAVGGERHPPVLHLRAQNVSSNGSANVEGVLMVYNPSDNL
jgi:hypothetical protein